MSDTSSVVEGAWVVTAAVEDSVPLSVWADVVVDGDSVSACVEVVCWEEEGVSAVEVTTGLLVTESVVRVAVVVCWCCIVVVDVLSVDVGVGVGTGVVTSGVPSVGITGVLVTSGAVIPLKYMNSCKVQQNQNGLFLMLFKANFRRYMAEILWIRRKTPYIYLISQSNIIH